jgi:hypothetical protein
MHLGPQQGLLEVHSPQMRLDCATNQAKQYTLVQRCGKTAVLLAIFMVLLEMACATMGYLKVVRG